MTETKSTTVVEMYSVVTYHDTSDSLKELVNLRVYKKRWIVLFLYCFTMIFACVQTVQYVVLADRVAEFYQVSYTSVNITYAISLLMNVLLSVPASYFIDTMGLYKTASLSALMIVVSAWLKTFSIDKDRFWLIILAQLIVSVPQTFLSPFPMKLASVWFGANEVSTACSIGILSTSVGQAVAFIIPIFFDKGSSTENVLFLYSFYDAVIVTVLGLAILLCFDEEPPIPPSLSVSKRLLNTDYEFGHFRETLSKLLSNRSFMVYAFAFAASFSAKNTLATTVNELILHYHKNAYRTISIVAIIITLVLILGSFFSGRILDRYKIYKQMTYFIHATDVIFTALYFFTACLDIWVIYLAVTFSGFFTGAIYLVGAEMLIELSYPLSVNVMGCLITCLKQVISIFAIMFYTILFEKASVMWANVFVVVLNSFSFILLFFMKFELFRQESESSPLLL